MAGPRYITDAQDLLIDIDRLDSEYDGQITPVLRDTIEHMLVRYRFTPERIARQLQIDEKKVVEIANQLHSSGFRLK